MVQSNAAYSNNFSTIFRAARGAQISAEVRDGDLEGKDPLPKYVKKSKVWLPGFEEPAQPVSAAHISALLPWMRRWMLTFLAIERVQTQACSSLMGWIGTA
jgi:hypothetical protein